MARETWAISSVEGPEPPAPSDAVVIQGVRWRIVPRFRLGRSRAHWRSLWRSGGGPDGMDIGPLPLRRS